MEPELHLLRAAAERAQQPPPRWGEEPMEWNRIKQPASSSVSSLRFISGILAAEMVFGSDQVVV
jgi:hypothetical protein